MQTLGYEEVALPDVMNWYAQQIAPFSPKKPKEFPDAFALSSLLSYAGDNECTVAVVSQDEDFRAACDRYAALLYFESLPHLTETLLVTDERREAIRSVVAGYTSALEQAILKEAEGFLFVHELKRKYEVDHSTPLGARVESVRLVALGRTECTVTFSGEIEVEHALIWEAHEDEGEGFHHQLLLESHPIDGSAKIVLDKDGVSVKHVRGLRTDEVVFTVTEDPD